MNILAGGRALTQHPCGTFSHNCLSPQTQLEMAAPYTLVEQGDVPANGNNNAGEAHVAKRSPVSPVLLIVRLSSRLPIHSIPDPTYPPRSSFTTFQFQIVMNT